MLEFLESAGLFAWPLGLCSLVAAFIIVERLLSLQEKRVIPPRILRTLVDGDAIPPGDRHSVAGRIILFFTERDPDTEQLKAYARLQALRLERGLFILEVVIAASPLLGLMGTVTGLREVFAGVSPETGLPDPGSFVSGVALALTTTILGLAIAIPSLVFHGYLSRRVDTLAGQLDVGVERLLAIRRSLPESGKTSR